MPNEPTERHRQRQMEGVVMEMIGRQTETERVAKSWPRIIRAAAWPNYDKLFLAIATSTDGPMVVSFDLDAAKALRDNIDKIISMIESGELKVSGGGYPPLNYRPARDN